MVPPPNVGLRTTPFYNDPTTGFAVSGATTSSVVGQIHHGVGLHGAYRGADVRRFPGEDSFFADIPGVFDLLNPRILGPDGHGQTGGGVDGFKGFNVLTFAIQIPMANLRDTDAFTGARTAWEFTPRSAASGSRCGTRSAITPIPVRGSN